MGNKMNLTIVLILINLINVTLSLYNEKYRPQFHYSQPKGWANDPNGLVFHKDTYHLFYQYFPNGTYAGAMGWGHAVSNDLFHWTTLQTALQPNNIEYIWSGSAIVDENNVTGLQTNKDTQTMLAIFASHMHPSNVERTSLAYSNDNGLNWKQYPKNPIIANPNLRDFRDPKIFRYHNSHYVIVIAAGNHVKLYKSTDMLHWSPLSEFGQNQGSHQGVWECPDMFPLKTLINGKIVEKWVILVSTGPITQYFIGSFDGQKFTNDNPTSTVLWIDYGPDSYAGITFNSAPNDRIVFISWMSRWEYADKVPTDPWRGQFSIPRELKLVENSDKKLMLSSLPVSEISHVLLKSLPVKLTDKQVLHPNSKLLLNDLTKIDSKLLDIRITLDIISIDKEDVFGLKFSGERLAVYFNNNDNHYVIDRTNAGKHDFSDKFALKVNAPRLTSNKSMSLRIIIDQNSVELFADNGLTVMTALYFADKEFDHSINVFLDSKSKTSEIRVKELIINELKSVW